MFLPVLAFLQLAAAGPSAPTPDSVYNAREGRTSVRVPFLDARPAASADASAAAGAGTGVVVDGVLDEAVWRRAAVLTGFSQYQPVDGRPSPDSTEVRVWYGRDAIWFGIRAFEPHGEVRATLADRDKVGSDDNVEIHLDTYNERDRAFVFVVNALGVQADGTKSEGGGWIPGANIMPGQNDLSADFHWESRGRLTSGGYEVEVRIPFASLRYPSASVQDWGIQIQRNVQHRGAQDTWTPAVRASASFIAQQGTLVGLTGMHHGQVVQLNPELTNTVKGAPSSPPGGGWSYDSDPELGGNVRWGVGSNWVLNGTVKPDFSQVEADATQIAADERFALFYAERRPFFVEGTDQFNAPNTQVYPRTIVHPEAALKLTGKVGRTDVAVLSALDAEGITPDGSRPLVNIARLRRGFAAQSTAGLLYSERVGGGRSNRIGGADVRHGFGGMYFAQAQAVLGRTAQDGATRTAPLWQMLVDRTGRSWGFNYNLTGIGEGFATDNGFVPRTGIVQPTASNRFTLYGAPGALVEAWNVFGHWEGVWDYDGFFDGAGILESQLMLNNMLSLRGGWTVMVSPRLASYVFEAADYARLFTGTAGAPTPFVPSDRIGALSTQLNVSTPQYSAFSASVGMTVGRDVDFLETSRVRRLDYNASVDARPTQQLRIGATYLSTSFQRRRDDERTASTRIPRLKVEYQATRAIFFRMVAQYTAAERAPLRDPRTGQLLLVRAPDRTLSPSARTASNTLRADWLFSYRPSPGTVFFLGYGNTLTERDPLSFRGLDRTDDAFFVKVSYLFDALGGG
ncbi:MAG: carbohydrate binding family 9 domain-containing protein [Gemmatimonadetes bacterium]|nr:carbohydrate binding family 9 domain-containing protein [Gemmatimonadota bacterium]